jgi:MFS family permease
MSDLLRSSVLAIRDFRLLIINKFLVTFGTQMLGVIVGWQVFQMTHDPLALGLIGLAEALAFIGFALWAGHVADRTEKRRLILGSEVVIWLSALALWGLTAMGNRATLPIYGVIAASGMARAFLWSASSSYSELIVPKEIYSGAAAWNSSAWEIAAILGSAIGGLIYALAGPAMAYIVAVLMIVAGLYFAAQMKPLPAVVARKQDKVLESLMSGVHFVFRQRVILAALALDMFAVLFGGVVAVLPIFAEILKVGPAGLGLLRASQSVGAIGMAIYQTRRPPFKNTGKTLFSVVGVFGVCIILFALSKNFYLSMLLLAIAGTADNVSVIIRASVLQAATPDHMRGRVSAVNGIFIGSSNEIGAFFSGLAAKLLGIVPSVVFGGIMTLITVGLVAWRFPQLRKLKTVTNLGPEADGFNVEIEKNLL